MQEDKHREEKVNEIIKQTQDYLQNFNRFYSGTLYLDGPNESENKQSPHQKIQPTEKNEQMSVKKEKKVLKEVDLFGNETIKKQEWEFSESLAELNEMIHDCKKCQLWETRTNFVFGVGNPNADIVVIGEAPGADEDAKGEPFVGRAGQLLNKILEATGFQREEVFICNILKSRPPGNRNPLPNEVEACKPYLDKQLELINPKLILLLGRVAAESLLKAKDPLNKLRGKTHDYKGWKVRITFHPAALLRNPNWKKDTWEDMKQFKAMYDELCRK